MEVYFITFRSVTPAQRGEAVLKSRGIRCQLLRTPRWMAERGCGYCLRLAQQDAQRAVELLCGGGVPFRKVYLQQPDGTTEEVQL